MSRYSELRQMFTLPYQERAVIVRREMLASLQQARSRLAEIVACGEERVVLVFGERSYELVDIAFESAAGLQRLLDTLDPECQSVIGSEDMRDLRHDLRGPVGTIRGAVMMLARRPRTPEHPMAVSARAVLAAAEDMRDIVDALTEEQERE